MKISHSQGNQFIIGLDIGGTKCAVVLGDRKMRIYDRICFPTQPHRGFKVILRQLFKTTEEITARNGLKINFNHKMGVSCGGPLDSRKGLILSPPNLPGWKRVPIVHLLEKKFKCFVRLENDANACAVAEWKYGAGRGFQNLIFLTFGTGLGAGLILNGNLYRGTNDMAGEVGHIRLANDGPMGYGKKGSFEGFCSGGGIARWAKMQGGFSRTTQNLCEAAQRGDPASCRILLKSARYLGLGLSILIDLLNPERIIIGGIYSKNEKLFRRETLKVIQQEALAGSRSVCRIVGSSLGERIGDIGSLCVATMNEHN